MKQMIETVLRKILVNVMHDLQNVVYVRDTDYHVCMIGCW